MSPYYSRNSPALGTTDFSVGSFLAVEDGDTWFRARLLRLMENNLFCLRLVDTGKMVITIKEKMRPLVRQFGDLPCQAVRARLSLSVHMEVYEEEVVEWFKHVALNKAFVGKVNMKSTEKLEFTVFDTSDEDKDIVLNEELEVLLVTIKK